MRISTTPGDSSTTLHVHCSRLDAAVAVDLRNALGEAVAAAPAAMVIDLSEVSFIDSSGLGALIGAFKAAGTRSVALRGLIPAVRAVFRLTRVDRAYSILE